jgi:hypothetical protein
LCIKCWLIAQSQANTGFTLNVSIFNQLLNSIYISNLQKMKNHGKKNQKHLDNFVKNFLAVHNSNPRIEERLFFHDIDVQKQGLKVVEKAKSEVGWNDFLVDAFDKTLVQGGF